MKTPIFIGGTGRCGTTLVARMLGTHSDIANFGELRILTYGNTIPAYLENKIDEEKLKNSIPQIMHAPTRKGPNRVQQIAKYTKSDKVKEAFNRERIISEITKAKSKTREETVTIFINNLLHPIVEKRNYWIDKTPHIILRIDILYKSFPNMKVIHILRNPEDYCASIISMPWGPNTIEQAIDEYINTMIPAIKIYEEFPKDQYKIVTLEEFATNSRRIVEKLFNFVGIKITETEVTTSTKELKPQKLHIGRAQTDLTKKERDAIQQECQNLYLAWINKMWEQRTWTGDTENY